MCKKSSISMPDNKNSDVKKDKKLDQCRLRKIGSQKDAKEQSGQRRQEKGLSVSLVHGRSRMKGKGR